MTNGTKPGHKTTEFWISLAFNVACLIATALWPDDSARWIPLAAAGLNNAGYHVSRGQTKSGNGK